jgi:hypothetical protein
LVEKLRRAAAIFVCDGIFVQGILAKPCSKEMTRLRLSYQIDHATQETTQNGR